MVDVQAAVLSGRPVEDHDEVDLARMKYELELSAHWSTVEELLRVKDRLIAQLEATISERDTTIAELRGRLAEDRGEDDRGRGSPATNRGG